MLNIFKSKLKDKNPSTFINNGNSNLVSQTRHYPPDTKEWFNSIYAFNKNTVKLLPVADSSIIKLIKSYFNLYSNKLDKQTKYPVLRTRMRRLSTNRILVSKAELKHTNDKVLITLYLYNRQKKFYLHKIKHISLLGFKIIDLKLLIKKIKINLKNLIILKKETNFKNLIKFRGFKYLKSLRNILGIKTILSLKKKRYLRYKKHSKKKTINILYIREIINSRMKLIKNEIFNTLSSFNTLYDTFNWDTSKYKNYTKIYINKNIIPKYIEKGILYMYYKQVLFLNKSKFNSTYILPLKILIKKIYNKNVEFNLVTLKYFHLNSDILTQIMIIKLRKRKNRILRVLRTSLRAFNLPSLNKYFILDEVYNRKKKAQNIIVKDLLFDPLFLKKKHSDTLNNTLVKHLPVSLNIEFLKYLKKIALSKFLPIKIRIQFKNFLDNPTFTYLPPFVKNEYNKFYKNKVLNFIKHKVVNGIRMEASGRLTKRITAARSLFKLRYKGNLKNMDSSYKGFSSVILRGHFKSNLQYTKLSSKTRIGAFGLKGWINSN